ANELAFSCSQIQPKNAGILRFGINDTRIFWIYLRVESIATSNPNPLVIAWTEEIQRCRGRAPASIVLQSTINPVGPAEIDTDLVKLSKGNRVDVIPGFGLVIAEMDSAVRSNNQVVRIDWIDPHRMVIAMDAPELSCRIQTPAAVLRYIHRGAQHVDTL